MRYLRLFLAAALTLAALPAASGNLDDVVRSELRLGWRLNDGSHLAALHLRLAPGWKTYWRAPGDAGIPPRFDWSGSENARHVAVEWPTPEVFRQDGAPSIGYHDELVLPLRITPAAPGQDIRLEGRIDIGLCDDVCLPYTVSVAGDLSAGKGDRDPVITAALVSRPFSAAEAGVTSVTCRIEPIDGGLRVTARVEMPSAGGGEQLVIEAGNPEVWASFPSADRTGAAITGASNLYHVSGDAFALDRSAVRITVFGGSYAVDIQGCAAE